MIDDEVAEKEALKGDMQRRKEAVVKLRRKAGTLCNTNSTGGGIALMAEAPKASEKACFKHNRNGIV